MSARIEPRHGVTLSFAAGCRSWRGEDLRETFRSFEPTQDGNERERAVEHGVVSATLRVFSLVGLKDRVAQAVDS